MEIEEQLRSASDEMLDALEKLRVLESEKRTLPPSSTRFQKLAHEVERLAGTVTNRAQEQSELGVEAAEQHELAGESTEPIEPPREVTVILSEWRDAERRLGLAAPGSPEEAACRAEVNRLRAEYQRAHRAATKREPGE